MHVTNFNASDGWLYRFLHRHVVFKRRVFGKSASADADEVGPFCTNLNKLINDEGLLLGQVYNLDETGLVW